MKLTEFSVSNYRCFVDSESVSVGDGPLAIVGKNESGKSSLLRAIALLSDDSKSIDSLRNWPRALGISSFDASRDIARVTLELSEEDHAEAVEIDPSLSDLQFVSYAKKYNGRFELSIIDVKSPKRPPPLLRALTAIALSDSPQRSDAELAVKMNGQAFVSAVRDLVTSFAISGEQIGSSLDGFDSDLDAIDTRNKALVMLSKRLPRFRYFDFYQRVPGTLQLSEYLERSKMGGSLRVISSLSSPVHSAA